MTISYWPGTKAVSPLLNRLICVGYVVFPASRALFVHDYDVFSLYVKVNLHVPGSSTPPHIKVWRAHKAYLNLCRLLGGRLIK